MKNQGNVASGAITVVDDLPVGMTFVSASDNALNTGQRVSWDIANLAPDEKRSLQVIAKLTDVRQTSYINFAEIAVDSSSQYSTPTVPVFDKDSTPDGTMSNDPLVDTDDVDTDQIPGDEDDHDRAMLDMSQVVSQNPGIFQVPPVVLPRTGSSPMTLVNTAFGLLLAGAFVLLAGRRRKAALDAQ